MNAPTTTITHTDTISPILEEIEHMIMTTSGEEGTEGPDAVVAVEGSVDLFENDFEIAKLYVDLMSDEDGSSTSGDQDCSSSSSSSLSPISFQDEEFAPPSPIPSSQVLLPPTSSYPVFPTMPLATAAEDSAAACSTSAPTTTTPPMAAPPCIVIPPMGGPLEQTGFVNVLLLVDPLEKKVVMPSQTLSYQDQTCTVQETELKTFPKQTIDMFTQQVVLQQQQQQQQQSTATSTLLPTPMSAATTTTAVLVPLPPPVPVSEAPSVASGCSSQMSTMLLPDPTTMKVPFSILTSETPIAPKSNAFVAPATTLSKQHQQSSAPPQSPKDLPPLRANSAYNFFFRDERERLLENRDLLDEDDATTIDMPPRNLTAARAQQLLSEHWNRDRTVKRKHRKCQGRIAFAELSRRISRAWKRLNDSEKAFYKEISDRDWDRYQRELQEYKLRQSSVTTEQKSPVAVVA